MNSKLDNNYSCDSKLVRQNLAARIISGSGSRTYFVCELLKTFSTPMDIFSLNRSILNEIMKISGAGYSAISYFDDNFQLKYIQKSNGGFEKKKKRPRFYFELSSAETVSISKISSEISKKDNAGKIRPKNLKDNYTAYDDGYKFFQSDRENGYDKITFIPLVFGRYKIGIVEIYFKENSKTDNFINSADFKNMANIFSNCVSAAVVNCIIRTENLNLPEDVLVSNDKIGQEKKILLTNETFLTYTELITALIAVTTTCEYAGAFLYDAGSNNFRIVGEKQINPLSSPSYIKSGVISDSGVAQNRLISAWLVENAVYEKQVIDNKTVCKKSGIHKTGDKNYLAAPMLNLKSGSGGIAVINKLISEEKEFNYDETMALLLLTNYLGTFYDSFLHASDLESKAKSLSIVYSIANISNNIFNSALEFETAIRTALMQISFYMKSVVCGMIIYDTSAKSVNVYSSSECDVSEPFINLLNELDLKFWENPSGEQNQNVESGILNLSRVNVFKERLARFNLKICEILPKNEEFEVLLKPVYHKKIFIGYMFILNSECLFDEDYYRVNEKNDRESESFIKAVSSMLAAVIISQKNYSEIMRLEKYAARMERLAALGEVAAGIAHEIRNPLGGISLFATSIESSLEETDKRKKWIGHIIDAVNRIGNMVSNLLNFSREEIINKRKYNLINLINESIVTLSYELKDKNIMFEHVLGGPESAPDNKFGFEIYCDTEKIKQVIINLLTNAVNAFEKTKHVIPEVPAAPQDIADGSGGKVTCDGGIKELKKIIVAYNYDAVNDQTVMWVANNGPEIPDELKEKIFRPFFTTRSRGTGLGLAISQKIIDAHGGSIKILNSKKQSGNANQIDNGRKQNNMPGSGNFQADQLKIPEKVYLYDTIFEIRLPNENKICYNK